MARKRLPDIAGFEWDEQRQRYFRQISQHIRPIAPSSQLRSNNILAESRSSVSDQDDLAVISSSSLPHLSLLIRARTLNGLLSNNHRIHPFWLNNLQLRYVNHRQVLTSDKQYQQLSAGEGDDNIMYSLTTNNQLIKIRLNDKGSLNPLGSLPLYNIMSSVCAMHVLQQGTKQEILVCTTTGSHVTAGTLLISQTTPSTSLNSRSEGIQPVEIIFPKRSLWTSVYSSLTNTVVVGGTKFIQQVDVQSGKRKASINTGSDTFALSFLHHPSQLLSGHRDGTVRIYDFRQHRLHIPVYKSTAAHPDTPASVSSICVTQSGVIYALNTDGVLRLLNPTYHPHILSHSQTIHDKNGTVIPAVYKLGMCSIPAGGMFGNTDTVVVAQRNHSVAVWQGERRCAIFSPQVDSVGEFDQSIETTQLKQLITVQSTVFGITQSGNMCSLGHNDHVNEQES